jgi:Mg-chelatase subunit ChlD
MSDHSQENPDTHQNSTPQEQLEMRVLSMLLGETNEADTQEILQLLEQDPQLHAYAEKMQKTMGLVEESANSLWAEETAALQQLSDDRRKVLEDLWDEVDPNAGKVEVFPSGSAEETSPKSNIRKFQLHPIIPVAAAASLAILIGGVWFPKILKQEEDGQVAMSAQLPEKATSARDFATHESTEEGKSTHYNYSISDEGTKANLGDRDGEAISPQYAEVYKQLNQAEGEVRKLTTTADDVSGVQLGAFLKSEEIARRSGVDRNRDATLRDTEDLKPSPLGNNTVKDLDMFLEIQEVSSTESSTSVLKSKFEKLPQSKPQATAAPAPKDPEKSSRPQPTGMPVPVSDPQPEPEPTAPETAPFPIQPATSDNLTERNNEAKLPPAPPASPAPSFTPRLPRLLNEPGEQSPVVSIQTSPLQDAPSTSTSQPVDPATAVTLPPAPTTPPPPPPAPMVVKTAREDLTKAASGPALPGNAPAPGQSTLSIGNESQVLTASGVLSNAKNTTDSDPVDRLRQSGGEKRIINQFGDNGSSPKGVGMKVAQTPISQTGGIPLTDNLTVSGFIDGAYGNSTSKEAERAEKLGVDQVELDYAFTGNSIPAEVPSDKKSHDDGVNNNFELSTKSDAGKLSKDARYRGWQDELKEPDLFSRNITVKGGRQEGAGSQLPQTTEPTPERTEELRLQSNDLPGSSEQPESNIAASQGNSLKLKLDTDRTKESKKKSRESNPINRRDHLAGAESATITLEKGVKAETVEELEEVADLEAQTGKSLKEDLGIEVEIELPEPKPEVLTAQSPFSTFSLNVTDASFRLCEASLLSGQLPPPHIVRAEEFINAFDYRDPAPVGGKSLSFAWDRSRHPFAHNRDLVRFSIQTAAEGRQGGQPLNLVLTIDNSGSMERADRVAILQEALKVLSSQLKPQDKVSVIAFARTPRLWINGMNGDAAARKLAEYDAIVPQGGTNIESALNLAYETAQNHFIQNGNNRVILLTDGAANLGEVVPNSLRSTVEVYRKKAIALDCFGIGWDGYNDHLMEALARNGDGRYAFLNSPKDVERDFARKLAGVLTLAAADVKVQVEFNPKRVKTHRQIGYLRHQLKKEDFRNNAVDAAEIGSAESGNAMYVLQIDPKGSGSIGTVRVRYREPATGEYKETSWDLPYKSNVPALDQADPAMRLAATAASFAEWLGRSPFAGDVELPKLQQFITGLQSEFPAHSPVQSLLQMIRVAELSK